MNLWTVDIAVVGQQNIARPKIVGSSFNDITDISGDKNINFIKSMLMKIDGKGGIAAIMVVFIKAFCHDLAKGKFVDIHNL